MIISSRALQAYYRLYAGGLPTLRPHTFAPHTLHPYTLPPILCVPHTLRPHTSRPYTLRPYTLRPHTLRSALCAPLFELKHFAMPINSVIKLHHKIPVT